MVRVKWSGRHVELSILLTFRLWPRQAKILLQVIMRVTWRHIGWWRLWWWKGILDKAPVWPLKWSSDKKLLSPPFQRVVKSLSLLVPLPFANKPSRCFHSTHSTSDRSLYVFFCRRSHKSNVVNCLLELWFCARFCFVCWHMGCDQQFHSQVWNVQTAKMAKK